MDLDNSEDTIVNDLYSIESQIKLKIYLLRVYSHKKKHIFNCFMKLNNHYSTCVVTVSFSLLFLFMLVSLILSLSNCVSMNPIVP